MEAKEQMDKDWLRIKSIKRRTYSILGYDIWTTSTETEYVRDLDALYKEWYHRFTERFAYQNGPLTPEVDAATRPIFEKYKDKEKPTGTIEDRLNATLEMIRACNKLPLAEY